MSIISFIESLQEDHDLFEGTVSKLTHFEGVTVEFNNGKSLLPFAKKHPWLRIYGIEDYLAEGDGPEETYWHFSPDGIRKLNSFITDFSETYRKGFLFSFAWGGNDIGATIKNVNLEQLKAIIKDNKLEEVTYRVEVGL